MNVRPIPNTTRFVFRIDVLAIKQLLEDYFALRGQWYRGPKEAFATLRADDPRAFALFESALARAAPLEALAALVAYVGDDSVAG